MAEKIRVRFAPSPTGLFHIGSARVALFNYLFAKKNEGKFILRIEDTDQERSKEEYEIDIKESLSYLGLPWDEGPEAEGGYGPYHQSKRGKIYQKYIKRLIDEKIAYYCFCSQEELEKERKKQEDKKLPPKYSGKCKNLNEKEIDKLLKEGKKPTIRFKIDNFSNEKIKYTDLIKGEIEFDPCLFGDFIIIKSTGEPTFLLSNIIDDVEMKITHVIRGDDHISNTPKQIMIASALCLTCPEYGHLPMILNPDKSKLSKRKNPTSVTKDFRDRGYLSEAMINFLVLLGWSPKKKDLYSNMSEKPFFLLDELIYEFSVNDVGKSPAIFDQAKLDYFNGYYIRKLPLGELSRRCLPYLIKAGLVKKESEEILKAVHLVQERMKRLDEAPELMEFFFRQPKYDKKLLTNKNLDKEKIKNALEESVKVLEKENDYSRDSIEELLRALAVKINTEPVTILWPIRVALSGKSASPGTFELIEYFGKNETIKRIKIAIDMLQ